MQKAILLDRDGVVNRERGDYTYLLEHFSFVDGIVELIRYFNKNGFKVLVITNQGGVAKGIYGIEHVERLHQFIQHELEKSNAYVDEFFYCPHHDSISNCLCRKPKSLMVERALHKYQIKPENAMIIGDSDRDIIAARSAGVSGIKIEANILPKDLLSRIENQFYDNHE